VAPAALVQRGPRRRKGCCAITFDDGPHPEQTPRILDCLDEHGARATFFVIGAKVASLPGLTREVAARGHQLGNHGYSHRDARKVALSETRQDVLRTQHLLEDTIGMPIARDYRPPYGRISPLAFLALVQDGFRFVYWSKDSRDYRVKDTASLLTSVRSLDVGDGDILLFHDDYVHTSQAIGAILVELRARGLHSETVAALTDRDRG